MALTVGNQAPLFTCNDQNGRPVRLADFKGKRVILYFYPKDLTSGCTAQACNLRDNFAVLQKAGYVILGVSKDSEASHRKFIEKENLPFTLLSDEDLSVHQSYGAWVEKSMYGKKYMGTARITFVIDAEGIVERIIDKVNTKSHSEQILSEK